MRFILLVLLGWMLWRFCNRWYQNAQLKKQDSNLPPPPVTQQHLGAMVRCDYCGLYFPEIEATRVGGACYCCEAHKQATQR